MADQADLDAVQARRETAKRGRLSEGDVGLAALTAIDALVMDDLPALMAEVRRARESRDELHEFYGDLDANDATATSAYRLSRILRAWDDA